MKFPKKKENSEAKANASGAGWKRPALSSPAKRKIKDEKKGVVGTEAVPAHDPSPNQILQTHSHTNFRKAGGGGEARSV